MEKLGKNDGEALVRLARRSLQAVFDKTKIDSTEKFREKRGAFVTLLKWGRLRGCIGLPFPSKALGEAIIDAARSASRDPRFKPLEKKELSEITVEVTVLTAPKEVEGKRPDAPKKIEVGRHGVIVTFGNVVGLFLPQVAPQQGWDAEETLAQACLKAGLSPDAWLDKEVKILTFEGQIFAEQTPNGTVVEKNFKG